MSFDPIWDNHSRVLILGTYPSPKSREQGFYYGHPQNRFWKLLASILDCPTPTDIPQKKQMLLSHGIALWDVCDSCGIDGASDATIRDVIPNDIADLLHQTGITQVFCNGAKAYELYQKHIGMQVGVTVYKMPSTSPANAASSMEKLQDAWRILQKFL